MRVLLIDVNAEESSTGNIVSTLYKSLIERGNDAIVCYARGASQYGAYKFAIDAETHLHALLTRVTGYTDCFSPISTMRLINKIKEFKPDIINMHELHSYFLNSKMFFNFLKKENIKVVWTMHCEIAYTGRCGMAENCERYKASCGSCPRLHAYPKTLLFDRSSYMLSKKRELYKDINFKIITPSPWLANKLRGSIVQNKALSIIPNGIDDAFFVSEPSDIYQKMGIEGDVGLFMTPKFSDENKGVKRLLAIAKRLPDISFVILAKDYKGDMHIANNVYCIGGVTRPEIVAEYMASANFFLLLSRFESFSLTLAQSLACGTQAIAYMCGAPETVYDTPFVSFANFDDEDEIIRLIVRHEHIDRFALRDYAQKFSNNAMCERYMEEYRCLLEENI